MINLPHLFSFLRPLHATSSLFHNYRRVSIIHIHKKVKVSQLVTMANTFHQMVPPLNDIVQTMQSTATMETNREEKSREDEMERIIEGGEKITTSVKGEAATVIRTQKIAEVRGLDEEKVEEQESTEKLEMKEEMMIEESTDEADITTKESEQKESIAHNRAKRKIPPKELPWRLQDLFYGEPEVLPNHKWQVLYSGPPNVYLIKDLMTDKDISHFDDLISLNTRGFQSSFVNNEKNEEVLTEYRTSRYLRVKKGQDAIIRSIEGRIAQSVGLPSENIEPLQIVRYTDGQHFDVHHDAGTLCDDGEVELVQPKRLVTVFIYLNSLPEGEGHTEFPLLNEGKGLSVRPSRGDAVVWCNILPDGNVDPLLQHKACPVSKGLYKYGINVWFSETSMHELSLEKSNLITDKRRKVEGKTSALDKADSLAKTYHEKKNPSPKQRVKKKGVNAAAKLDYFPGQRIYAKLMSWYSSVEECPYPDPNVWYVEGIVKKLRPKNTSCEVTFPVYGREVFILNHDYFNKETITSFEHLDVDQFRIVTKESVIKYERKKYI